MAFGPFTTKAWIPIWKTAHRDVKPGHRRIREQRSKEDRGGKPLHPVCETTKETAGKSAICCIRTGCREEWCHSGNLPGSQGNAGLAHTHLANSASLTQEKTLFAHPAASGCLETIQQGIEAGIEAFGQDDRKVTADGPGLPDPR